MALIKNQQLQSDSFRHISDEEALPASGDIIVSQARFLAEQDALKAHQGQVGVQLKSDTKPAELEEFAKSAALIAIEFPKFVDGRGYSLGRILRDRCGFKGELRAVGHVLRDQLLAMYRCGFDAYELTLGKDAEGALEAFKEFSVCYQSVVNEPKPLFRRRA